MEEQHDSYRELADTEDKYFKYMSESKDQMWKCGEHYQFPIPGPEGDPWQALLTPLLEKDKARCDAWKEEVQNLLIFAGLFSAVVTAFVIETYKGLQQDPSVTMILLLSRVATDLESPGNHTSSFGLTLPVSSPPAASTVRINIFFFISLILSLTTVLVGIVSLQWLREHQAYNGSLTPQNAFASINMRSEALESWRVPEVFSALPLLLQLALILFFVGIIEFLRGININVAIPVSLVIGLTLLFLITTTILPTLQGSVLQHPSLKINNNIPVPCPYKSPQSQAFRRMATSSKFTFSLVSTNFSVLYWVGVQLYLVPRQLLNSHLVERFIKPHLISVGNLFSNSFEAFASTPSTLYQWVRHLFKIDTNSKSLQGFEYMSSYIFDYWRVDTSFEFDVMWLSIRDNYFQSICPTDSWLYEMRFTQQDRGGLYDDTHGLCKELYKENVNANADFEEPIFTIYQCEVQNIGSLTEPLENADIIGNCSRNQYLATLLGYDKLTPSILFPTAVHGDAIIPFIAEERAFILLHEVTGKLSESNLVSPKLEKHLAEVYFRLIGHLYSQPRRMHALGRPDEEAPGVIFAADQLYAMDIFGGKNQPFTTQWALTLRAYFEAWDRPTAHTVNFECTFHAHPFLLEYVWYFWKEVDHEFSKKTLSRDTTIQIMLTFRTINRLLTALLGTPHQQALDCLFYPAALYTQICRRRLPNHAALDQEIACFLPTIVRCKTSIAARGSRFECIFGGGAYDEHQEMVLFSEAWWNILFRASESLPAPQNPPVDDKIPGGTSAAGGTTGAQQCPA